MRELAARAWQRDLVLFSDFMDLNELNILRMISGREYGVRILTSGGCENAERQMAAFVPEALFSCQDGVTAGTGAGQREETHQELHFPVSCLHIRPQTPKFAEKLSHRDYLGAILGTGIERCKTGDIIMDDGSAWLFCCDTVAGYIAEELTSVRNTAVTVSRESSLPPDVRRAEKEITGTVSSLRPDLVAALAFGKSRSAVSGMIAEGSMMINGKCVTSCGYHLKNGDIISMRGLGKMRFNSALGETKKGKISVSVSRYL